MTCLVIKSLHAIKGKALATKIYTNTLFYIITFFHNLIKIL